MERNRLLDKLKNSKLLCKTRMTISRKKMSSRERAAYYSDPEMKQKMKQNENLQYLIVEQLQQNKIGRAHV